MYNNLYLRPQYLSSASQNNLPCVLPGNWQETAGGRTHREGWSPLLKLIYRNTGCHNTHTWKYTWCLNIYCDSHTSELVRAGYVFP